MEKTTHLEAPLFTAVLENCVNQLSILGCIMPVSYRGKPDLSHTSSQEIKEIIETQKELDINNQELTSARQGSGERVTSTPLKSIAHKQQWGKTEDLKSVHHLSSRAKKQSVLSIESLEKIQADWQYASDIIADTMKKLQESGTFNSLTGANERKEAKKSKFYDDLIRSEEGKKEIKALKEQLQVVKKETETELQNRDDMIACLQDELQKMKAKTDMERCYMKKSTDIQIYQTQKQHSNADNVLDKEIQKLRRETEEENRVHTKTQNVLRNHYKIVGEKAECWVDNENDVDAKEKELDDLKASKANNLEIMQRIAKECLTFEETIIRDRAEKEAERRKLERDALELKSILKLQSWWKGTMVRRYLGPYEALKKMREKQLLKQNEKGKKGKSGAKKKKR
ncbi:DRC9 protein, partial [Piaya cayana]|nr:DRC9 protein [Piaya cayana]